MWRLILTDTETLSGVAPVCPQQTTTHLVEDGSPEHDVYGCCPQPHLECWSEVRAKQVMTTLNYFEVETCA